MTQSTTSRRDDRTRNVAVLIDGDNAQPSLISDVLAEVAKYGTITVRRAYGDWTTQRMSGWKAALHEGGLSVLFGGLHAARLPSPREREGFARDSWKDPVRRDADS